MSRLTADHDPRWIPDLGDRLAWALRILQLYPETEAVPVPLTVDELEMLTTALVEYQARRRP